MALLKFLKGNYASLNNAAIAEGQVLICGDTGEMFVDVAADKRVKIGDFVVVDTLANLEALDATSVPTSRLYYVEDGNILARSNGTGWIQINKQRTADEVKTLIGLANYELKSDAEAKLTAAKGYTDAEVKKVSDYVGTFASETATTVVGYINEKTSGIATDANLKLLEDRVGTAEGDIDAAELRIKALEDANKAGGAVATAIADAQKAADDAQADVDALEEKVDVEKVSTAIAESKKSILGTEEDGSEFVGTVKSATEAAEAAQSTANQAKDAAATAQGEIDDLEELVGTLPEGTTATTVVELVTMAQDAADEAQKDVDELAGKVGTVPADKTIVQMIADAQTAATYDDTEIKEDIKANADAIALLNNNAETAGSVDYKIAQAIAGVMENPDETMNSIQELVTWTQNHAKDALELSNQVSANKTALETLNGGEEVTGSVAAAVKAEKDRAVAKENELAKAIQDQATSDAATYETKTDASGKLTEAKNHADGLNTAMDTRVKALEAIDHEHSNKELLDTYTQTEANLADAVAKKHSHANAAELDKILDGDVEKWNAAEGNAKAHAEAEVKKLADGAVATNTAAIDTLNGTVEEEGSVAKTVADAVKVESDRAKAAEKANADAILLKANTADVYAKTETYTKTEIEALLTWGSF